jgi:hypothetical protein
MSCRFAARSKQSGQACLQAPCGFISVQLLGRLFLQSTKAKLFPIVRPHQDNVGRLNKQPDIPVASLGNAAQDRFAACAVLVGNKSEPRVNRRSILTRSRQVHCEVFEIG